MTHSLYTIQYLSIEDTAQVGPGHGKVRPCLDSFQVAGLEWGVWSRMLGTRRVRIGKEMNGEGEEKRRKKYIN